MIDLILWGGEAIFFHEKKRMSTVVAVLKDVQFVRCIFICVHFVSGRVMLPLPLDNIQHYLNHG